MKKQEVKQMIKNIFVNAKDIKVCEEYSKGLWNVELTTNKMRLDINIDENGKILFVQDLTREYYGL